MPGSGTPEDNREAGKCGDTVVFNVVRAQVIFEVE